jgi:hypothetical protein
MLKERPATASFTELRTTARVNRRPRTQGAMAERCRTSRPLMLSYDRSPKSGPKDFADTGPPVPNSGVGTREGDDSPPRFSTQMQMQGGCHRPDAVHGPAPPTYSP